MELPITFEDAADEWQRFEEYLVSARYAVRDPLTGVPLEHDISQVLKRVSREFTDPEVAAALLDKRIITATPFLMNGGNPYTRRRGYYSCYPLGYVEDSTDAIFAMERDLVSIFQHAGGGGIDISKLRPKGSPVDRGQGTASGPVTFAKGFSQLSARISQGGKRRGALMIQADWDIKDIKEFITFKGNNPGLYAGCNVSVNVTSDKFWEQDDLIDLIAEYIWRSGDPGLLFVGKSMADTPVPAKYNPIFSNPCGEYLSTRDTACNLVTVDLTRCQAAGLDEYLTAVYESARLAALAGNEILDMGGFPPIERIREATRRFRPIGVGMTGLHAAMNFFDISYADNEKAPWFAKASQLALMLGSMQGSMDSAAAFRDKNGREPEIREWDAGYVDRIEEEAAAFTRSGLEDKETWLARVRRIFGAVRESGGMYNSVTTSQPPAGSISQLLRVACTGIEPYYAVIQNRRVKAVDGSWREFTLVPLEFYSYDREKLAWIKGQTAHAIDPYQQIRILEACQTFNHTAVSKTVNLPVSATADDIKRIIYQVRDTNLKGITMFRELSMDGVLSDVTAEARPFAFSEMDERTGSTFKFRGPSPLYITANHGGQNHIREVFLNTTKSGSTLHGMCEALGRVVSVALQHDYRLIGKIAATLKDISSDGTWSNGILGRVYSIPAALAKVLDCASREMNGDPDPYTGPSAYGACPVCGKLSLRRSGGCNQCVSCGYSSC